MVGEMKQVREIKQDSQRKIVGESVGVNVDALVFMIVVICWCLQSIRYPSMRGYYRCIQR